jgi:type I restriction enzyme, S subunit
MRTDWTATTIMNRVTRLAKATAGQFNIGVGMCRHLLPVPLAPANEQGRIVDRVEELLSDLDAGVAALERVKANLKRYRASVLKAAVEGRLTQSWRAAHRPTETGAQLLGHILKERRRKWEDDQLAAFAAAGKPPPNNWRARYKEPIAPDTTNLPELPESWCWASIEQLLAEPTCNGISIKGTNAPPGVPALRLSAMSVNGFNYSDRRHIAIPRDVADDLAIREADFFVSRGNGSLRLVGRGTLAQDPDGLVVFPDTMIRIRMLDAPLLAMFISRIWSSRSIRGQIEQKARTTAGIYKISQQDVRGFVVPIPCREEQEQIVEITSEYLTQADAADNLVKQALLRAARLRQSILKRAFAGKLVAQDPADEPAAVLLARIQQFQAATAATQTKAKQPSDEFLRRAAIVSYTVKRLAAQPSFGRTQLEKTLHLAQSHLGIDLGLKFERYAAGPFDKSIYRLEGAAKKSGWFTKQNRRRFGVTYHPGPKIDAICQHAARLLGDKQADFDRLLDHMAAMNTDEAELFATAYAAWNDLMIDGRPAVDASIIAEVHGWHESKKRFTPAMIRKRIEWMRLNGYVPMGHGQRTRAVDKPTQLRT